MLEILKLLLLLGLVVVANIVLGTFKNIKFENMAFDYKLLIEGFIKGAVIAFGFFAISLVLLQLPELSTELGIEPQVMILGAIALYVTKVGEQLIVLVGLKKASEDAKIVESSGE